MQLRLKILIGLFLIIGIGAYMLSPIVYVNRTEDWMGTQLPASDIPGFRFNSVVKMDQTTYETLQPFGIIGRDFIDKDGRRFEITVIASNNRKAFHDPRVCFSAQGWQLVDPTVKTINVPVLGKGVLATVMGLQSSNAKGSAMYFYHGPYGWRSTPHYMPFDMLVAKLTMRKDIDGVFYRVLVSPGGKSLEEDQKAMEQFANTYFSEVKKIEPEPYFVPSS